MGTRQQRQWLYVLSPSLVDCQPNKMSKYGMINTGSCYAISRGALRKLVPIFDSELFRDVVHSSQFHQCRDREGAFEDPSMGVCLHSIGIDPANTLDRYNRERFFWANTIDGFNRYNKLEFKKQGELAWYLRLKPEDLAECCAQHVIALHDLKPEGLKALHEKYNVAEGVNGKRFEVPQYPTLFRHGKLNFPVDEWRNSLSKKAKSVYETQRVYHGPKAERVLMDKNY